MSRLSQARAQARRLDGLDYITGPVPVIVPEGKHLVHNNVYPVTQRNGTRGSRRWWVTTLDGNQEECSCPWAPAVRTHYRTTFGKVTP